MVIFIDAKKNVLDYLWVVLSTLQDGGSPLMTASEHGHLNIVRLLIKQGANINSQTKVSVTVRRWNCYIY